MQVSNSSNEANIDWVIYFINLGLTNLLWPQEAVRASTQLMSAWHRVPKGSRLTKGPYMPNAGKR